MNFFIVYVALPALFYRILAQTPPGFRIRMIHPASGEIGSIKQVRGEPRLAKQTRELNAIVQ